MKLFGKKDGQVAAEQKKEKKQKPAKEPKQKMSITEWMAKHPLFVGNVGKGIVGTILSGAATGIVVAIGKVSGNETLTNKSTLIAVASSTAATSAALITVDTVSTLKLMKDSRVKLQEELDAAAELEKNAEQVVNVGTGTENLTDEQIQDLINNNKKD